MTHEAERAMPRHSLGLHIFCDKVAHFGIPKIRNFLG